MPSFPTHAVIPAKAGIRGILRVPNGPQRERIDSRESGNDGNSRRALVPLSLWEKVRVSL